MGIIRHGKPILAPVPANPVMSRQVYNAGAVRDEDGTIQLFPRIKGVETYKGSQISRIARAISHDGVNFTLDPDFLFSPKYSWEYSGCEDPRIVYLEESGVYVMTYTAYDGHTARIATSFSTDLAKWGDHRLMLPHYRGHPDTWGKPDWCKAAGLIPSKIGGEYFAPFGDLNIWLARSKNLEIWTADKDPLLMPRPHKWDGGYIEMGPPPIRIREGWLMIYHGIERTEDLPGNPRVYRLGAAVLDADNPRHILMRSDRPFLQPEGWEKLGYLDIVEGYEDAYEELSEEQIAQKVERGELPQVVFCCGMIPTGERRVRLYYGAADRFTGTCEVSLDEMNLVPV